MSTSMAADSDDSRFGNTNEDPDCSNRTEDLYLMEEGDDLDDASFAPTSTAAANQQAPSSSCLRHNSTEATRAQDGRNRVSFAVHVETTTSTFDNRNEDDSTSHNGADDADDEDAQAQKEFMEQYFSGPFQVHEEAFISSYPPGIVAPRIAYTATAEEEGLSKENGDMERKSFRQLQEEEDEAEDEAKDAQMDDRDNRVEDASDSESVASFDSAAALEAAIRGSFLGVLFSMLSDKSVQHVLKYLDKCLKCLLKKFGQGDVSDDAQDELLQEGLEEAIDTGAQRAAQHGAQRVAQKQALDLAAQRLAQKQALDLATQKQVADLASTGAQRAASKQAADMASAAAQRAAQKQAIDMASGAQRISQVATLRGENVAASAALNTTSSTTTAAGTTSATSANALTAGTNAMAVASSQSATASVAVASTSASGAAMSTGALASVSGAIASAGVGTQIGVTAGIVVTVASAASLSTAYENSKRNPVPALELSQCASVLMTSNTGYLDMDIEGLNEQTFKDVPTLQQDLELLFRDVYNNISGMCLDIHDRIVYNSTLDMNGLLFFYDELDFNNTNPTAISAKVPLEATVGCNGCFPAEPLFVTRSGADRSAGQKRNLQQLSLGYGDFLPLFASAFGYNLERFVDERYRQLSEKNGVFVARRPLIVSSVASKSPSRTDEGEMITMQSASNETIHFFDSFVAEREGKVMAPFLQDQLAEIGTCVAEAASADSNAEKSLICAAVEESNVDPSRLEECVESVTTAECQDLLVVVIALADDSSRDAGLEIGSPSPSATSLGSASFDFLSSSEAPTISQSLPTETPTTASMGTASITLSQSTEAPTTVSAATASILLSLPQSEPPTAVPTAPPTPMPTFMPSLPPTYPPTFDPTSSPTTPQPTATPTRRPTLDPTLAPQSIPPTSQPTMQPTRQPTASPTSSPTVAPTTMPPTSAPTTEPTARSPTGLPTRSPTRAPTTRSPTRLPTREPTPSPTREPTPSPTRIPTRPPTQRPTREPTPSPTRIPTRAPTSSPTRKPTAVPTGFPTQTPTASPTKVPTGVPSTSTPTAVCSGADFSSTVADIYYMTFSQDVASISNEVLVATFESSYQNLPLGSCDARLLTVAVQGRYQRRKLQSSTQVLQVGFDISAQQTSPTGDLIQGANVATFLSDFSTRSGTSATKLSKVLTTQSPTSTPSQGPSRAPSRMPSSLPSTTGSAAPSQGPSQQPSLLPSITGSAAPSQGPSQQPSLFPSKTPSKIPSSGPSITPSQQPSQGPSQHPSLLPSNTPSNIPSSGPSITPSQQPSQGPSQQPSLLPSNTPSNVPSLQPSLQPSIAPSQEPSQGPSQHPSLLPSNTPSNIPSSGPSITPSQQPSEVPSQIPSQQPSQTPSEIPSNPPSIVPSEIPSQIPSQVPSTDPSIAPSELPSNPPSIVPSEMPSQIPSQVPSIQPSITPSEIPSNIPSIVPSEVPSQIPSQIPSEIPSNIPSFVPSDEPSQEPSSQPSTTGWNLKGLELDGSAASALSGSSVSMSSNGDVVAIGARGASGAAGEVRVFEWTGSVWNQRSSAIVGQASGDESGTAISLSSDGIVLAIGSPFNNAVGSLAGRVRVYEWTGSVWNQRGIDIDAEATDDNFGQSVSLSSDGSILAIGAPSNDGANGADSGHVRVFEWSGGPNYVQKGADIDGESAIDYSGFSVSLSLDGTTVAIGATLTGSSAGHVRVYEWTGGPNWVQKGNDIDGEAASDESGHSVSLNLDGTRLAIGAPFNAANGSSGHVRVYEWTGTAWSQQGSDIDGEGAMDQFGWSVSLSSDGNKLAVGARYNDGIGTDAGHARVYAWSGSVWNQIGMDIDGENTLDNSGYSVSLSADGTTVAIGADMNDGANGVDSGHVRVYQQ